MTTDTQITSEALQRLCRAIAPGDIAGRPVYIVLASSMPAEMAPQAFAWGYQSRFLDLAFHSWLSDTGRWRGRGPAIVLNDIEMMADASDRSRDDDQFRDELYRQRILATLAHELAHALSEPFDLRPIPPEIAADLGRKSQSTVKQWVSLPPGSDLSLAPWHGHDAAFIRTLCHVVKRAECILCEQISVGLTFANLHHGIRSSLYLYRDALRHELKGFDQSLTFADLRKCDPPKAFVELWKSDLHRWWSQDQSDVGLGHLVASLSPFVRLSV